MDIPQWIWNQPDRVHCVGDWRIATQATEGVDYHLDGRHLSTMIFGTSEHFRNKDRIREVLRTLRDRLGLDPELWKHQTPFYEEFFESFFKGNSTGCWVKVVSSRRSFRQRVTGDRGHSTHIGQRSRRLFSGRFLGNETLTFDGDVLPTDFLLMQGRQGIDRRDIGVYDMTILRTLRGDGLGNPISCRENWIQLGGRDREDRLARREGVNLTLKEYPAADPSGRMAPLVSLCRLSGDRKWVLSRCVSLSPGSGMAIDFRTVMHRTPFYFRSDLSNSWLMARNLTQGQHERFAHG
jgi:hypothetical protein